MKNDRGLGLNLALSEARARVLSTFHEGDAEKWRAHECLPTYEERLAWRRKEGHREFARLQRLDFHGAFRGGVRN